MTKLILNDIRNSLLLALSALLIGWLANGVRTNPLPLQYQPPAVRMDELISRMAGTSIEKGLAIPSVELSTLEQWYRKGEVLLIDARYRDFHDEGHIPGSLSLPRYSFGEDFQRLRPELEKHKDRTIVVYCLDNPCMDSLHVARALAHLGYGKVHHFPGGWEAWSAAGLPVEQKP